MAAPRASTSTSTSASGCAGLPEIATALQARSAAATGDWRRLGDLRQQRRSDWLQVTTGSESQEARDSPAARPLEQTLLPLFSRVFYH